MPPSMARFPEKLAVTRRVLRNLSVICLLPYDLATVLVDTTEAKCHTWNRPCRSSRVNFTFTSEIIDWEDIRNVMRKYKVNSKAAIYSVAVGAAFRVIEEAEQVVPSDRIAAFVPAA